jgi:excisionase family DNA binding protein
VNRIAYTVAEAAELCGVSENTLRELIASGHIYAAKMGNLRIGHVELERYLLGIPRPTQNDVATKASTVATPGDLRRPPAMVGADFPRGGRGSRRGVK